MNLKVPIVTKRWKSDWLKQLEEMGVVVSPTLRAALSITNHNAAQLSQITIRGYDDDGGEGNQTALAAENTGWSQVPDSNFIVRVEIQDTNNGVENNVNFQLQYNLNGTGWNNVNATSSVVTSSTSGNVTEDTTQTTDILSGQTGTFVAGTYDEADGIVANNNNIDFADSTADHTEVAFVVQIISTDVVNNDTIQFRVVRSNATLLENYDVATEFDVTVDETVAPQTGSITETIDLSDEYLTSLTTSVSDGGNELTDQFDGLVGRLGSISEGSDFGETIEPSLTIPTTEGTTLSDVLSVFLSVAPDDGAKLGASFSSGSVLGAISEGSDLGETFDGLVGRLGALSETGDLGMDFTTYTQTKWEAMGLSLGDSWSGVLTTITGAISEGADLGETITAIAAKLASINEGTDLGFAIGADLSTSATDLGIEFGDIWSGLKFISGQISEGITLGEVLALSLAISESEGVSLSDAFSSVVQSVGNISESTDLGLSLGTSTTTKWEAMAAVFGDTWSGTLAGEQTISEGINLGETFDTVLSRLGALTETVNFGLDFTNALTTILETTGAEFGETWLANLSLSTDLGINLGESWLTGLASSVSDGTELGESWLTGLSTTKTDQINFGDVWSGVVVGIFEGSITEGVELSDAFTKVISRKASFSDGIELSDIFSSLVSKIGTYSDTVELGDSWTGVVTSIITGFINEGAEFSDSYNSFAARLGTQSDTVNFSETVTPVLSRLGNYSDTVSLGDMWSSVVIGIFEGSITESIKLSDAYTTLRHLSFEQTDIVELSDVFDALVALLGTQTDTVELSDSYTSIRHITTSFSEGGKFADNFVGALLLDGFLTEGFTLSDAYTTTLSLLGSQTDQVEFGDLYEALAAKSIAQATGVTLGNLVSTSIAVSETEGLSVSDAWTTIIVRAGLLSDTTVLSDSLTSTVARVGTLTESVKLSDNYAILGALVASYSDTIKFGDTWSALLPDLLFTYRKDLGAVNLDDPLGVERADNDLEEDLGVDEI